MATVTYNRNAKLGKLATIKNPKSYGEWLSQNPIKSAADARSELASLTTRTTFGYGNDGEQLARSTLANDGYAAYLREAAKKQRDERRQAVGSEYVKSQQKALAGYANYLKDLRREDAERLTNAADSLQGLEEQDPLRAEEIANATNPTAAQKKALLGLYKKATTPGGASSRNEILDYMVKEKLTYREAYEYCRSLGFDTSTAKSMASSAVGSLDDTTRKMYELFGYN